LNGRGIDKDGNSYFIVIFWDQTYSIKFNCQTDSDEGFPRTLTGGWPTAPKPRQGGNRAALHSTLIKVNEMRDVWYPFFLFHDPPSLRRRDPSFPIARSPGAKGLRGKPCQSAAYICGHTVQRLFERPFWNPLFPYGRMGFMHRVDYFPGRRRTCL